MITLRLKGEEALYRTLIKVEGKVAAGAGEATKAMAQWIVQDIRQHWSLRRPSSPGKAPAIKTGNLDSSVKADGQGRTSTGRFSHKTGSDAKMWFVRIDTAEGDDPRDRGNYAQALEDPDYIYNRPFLRPAIERAKPIYPDLLKRMIKL